MLLVQLNRNEYIYYYNIDHKYSSFFCFTMHVSIVQACAALHKRTAVDSFITCFKLQVATKVKEIKS